MEWQHDNPSPSIFNLTEQTHWKTTAEKENDVIRHLIGTPYGNAQDFKENYIEGDAIIWYLENCDLSTTDLRRSLVQMKLAGWFDGYSGIMFGRSPAHTPVANYTIDDVYEELSKELHIPILYDMTAVMFHHK